MKVHNGVGKIAHSSLFGPSKAKLENKITWKKRKFVFLSQLNLLVSFFNLFFSLFTSSFDFLSLSLHTLFIALLLLKYELKRSSLFSLVKSLYFHFRFLHLYPFIWYRVCGP